MDAHVALELGDRRARVDRVDERLHRLVAAAAEERRAEDAVAAFLDVDLEEALGLALLDGARDARHGPLADPRFQFFLPDFRFAQADAAERRIGVERVHRDAVGPLAAGARDQVVGDDLVVVPRRVGEGALAVAVAERPDVRIAGAQRLVDLDVAALVERDAGGVEAEVVGVWDTSHREQHMRARDPGRAFGALQAHRDAVAALFWRHVLGLRAHLDAFGLENLLHRLRHVLVLARDEPRGHLDHGDARAEAAEHLAELQPDVAAADDDEVLGHEIDVHDRLVGEVGNAFDALQLGHERPAAYVEEDFLAVQPLTGDFQGI